MTDGTDTPTVDEIQVTEVTPSRYCGKNAHAEEDKWRAGE